MAQANRDENRIPTLLGVSSVDIATPTRVAVNPVTNAMLVEVSGSSGDGTILDGVDTGIKATVKDLTNSNPLVTAIVDANGDQITTFGGGTQYTEGDTDATITGTAIMMEVAANTLQPIQGTVADGLLVNLGTNNDISGTVTANAGTNLNTSGLALETGGNLATIVTSLGNLDNSVDGNYLNVNMNIAGTDVSANAGTLTAQTLRVTIATDDEVNNLLGTIDADTGNIATSLGNMDNSVDGNYLNTNLNYAGTDAPTGGGTEAGVLRVTIATDSTGVLSVDDNGSTLTVDGTVTANLSATDNTVLDNIDTAVTSKYISAIGNGVKAVTTAGTDVALAASTTCKRVTIQAQTDNTNIIAVGATGVDATIATGTGIVLYPGDVFEMDIDNLADVFIDSLVNGEGVRFTYFN